MSNRLHSQPGMTAPVPARRQGGHPGTALEAPRRSASPRPPFRWVLTAIGMVVLLALIVSAFSVWVILHAK